MAEFVVAICTGCANLRGAEDEYLLPKFCTECGLPMVKAECPECGESLPVRQGRPKHIMDFRPEWEIVAFCPQCGAATNMYPKEPRMMEKPTEPRLRRILHPDECRKPDTGWDDAQET